MPIRKVKDLRNELADAFADMKAGNLDVKQAEIMANMAGKMFYSVSVELKGHKLNGTKHNIDWLKD